MNITISGLVLHETFLRIQDSSLDIDVCRFEDSSQGVEIAVSTMNVMNIKITSSTFSRSNNCISVVVDSQSNSSHNTQVMFKLTNSFDGNVLADEGKVISFIELLSSKKSITSTVILENVRYFPKTSFIRKVLFGSIQKKPASLFNFRMSHLLRTVPSQTKISWWAVTAKALLMAAT